MLALRSRGQGPLEEDPHSHQSPCLTRPALCCCQLEILHDFLPKELYIFILHWNPQMMSPVMLRAVGDVMHLPANDAFLGEAGGLALAPQPLCPASPCPVPGGPRRLCMGGKRKGGA